MRRRLAARLAAAVAGLALLAAGGFRAWHPDAATPAGSARHGGSGGGAAVPASSQQDGAFARSAVPPGGAGPGDAFLTRDLRHRLERVLLDAGDAATPAELKQRALPIVGRHFAAADAVRAAQLLERYIDYRVALGGLQPPRDRTDPRALQQAIDARRQLRERHFAADEYLALFGEEEELDRYTVARLEIQRNAELTPAQKDAALRAAERDLSPAQRAARLDAVQHEVVAAQTAALDAAQASDHERYRQRSAQFGEAAAQQLAQLDREERDWQQRLTQYANARAAGDEGQLLALRQQLFSEQERLRIDAALALRALEKK